MSEPTHITTGINTDSTGPSVMESDGADVVHNAWRGIVGSFLAGMGKDSAMDYIETRVKEQVALAAPQDTGTTGRLPPVTEPGPDGQTYYPASAASVINRAGRFAENAPCTCEQELCCACDRCKLLHEIIQWEGARSVVVGEHP